VPNVIWSIGVSLDGYIADADGRFEWAAPGPAVHQVHNDQTRELSAHLIGRRLYETMLPWETSDPSAEGPTAEFSGIWQALPKVVFSRTLTAVEGNARLATATIEEEVARLEGDVAVGGAGLAAELARRGLIDEYHQFVYPVVVGGGTPYFPGLDHRIALELVETRTYGSGVVFLQYRRV